MELELNNNDIFNKGKYVLNDSKEPFKTFSDSSEIFLTQENNLTLKKEILRLISESQEVIKICTFILTDKEIYSAIIDKAENSNVAIFILTQLDQKKLINELVLSDFVTEEELKEGSAQTHIKYIKRLFDVGVHIRAAASIHAKFIVSDRKHSIITSANLTSPSLSINTESGVYLDDKEAVELDQLFDLIFKNGTTYRQFLGSVKKHKILIVQSDNKIDKNLIPSNKLTGLRYTYENITNNLYDEIIEIINESTEDLFISTYSIVSLKLLPEFTDSIKSAIKRGVQIFVFCRGMNYRNDHLEGSNTLQSIGCNIYADIFNHSKGIINHKRGLIFTANIDGNYGLKQGFEVGCLLNENQRQEFLRLHKYLIETAYYKFDPKPKRIDVFNTFKQYEKDKGIKSPVFKDELIIKVRNGISIDKTKMKEDLLFYGKKKDSEYIICDNSLYLCNRLENIFEIIRKEKPCYNIEKYVLKYHNLKLIIN
jgi:hypothetical protein